MNTPRILVIENGSKPLQELRLALVEEEFVVDRAPSAMEAQKRIHHARPDLILIDSLLPDMDGGRFCAQLKRTPATSHLGIFLFQSNGTSTGKFPSPHTGADLILVPPLNIPDVIKLIRARLEEPAPEEAAPESSRVPLHRSFSAHQFIRRITALLHQPGTTLNKMVDNPDFLTGLLLVLITPTLASLPKIFQGSNSFDVWIGFISTQLVSNFFMWIGIAGLLHMALPFLGVSLPMKDACAVAGWGWAPRLVSAVLSAFYGLTLQRWTGGSSNFSAGLDLVPGLPNSDWVRFLSSISLFDLWSAAITVQVVWILSGDKKREWNVITVLVGVVCLIFGTLTPY